MATRGRTGRHLPRGQPGPAPLQHLDEDALQALTDALRWRRPLDHTAQRLRDRAAENAVIDAEVARHRGQGLPVLDRSEWDSLRRLLMEDMRDADGQPVPTEQWSEVTGAAVILDQRRRSEATPEDTVDAAGDTAVDEVPVEVDDHSDDTDTDTDTDDTLPEDGDNEDDEDDVLVWVPVWVCTDPAAAGLRPSDFQPPAGRPT